MERRKRKIFFIVFMVVGFIVLASVRAVYYFRDALSVGSGLISKSLCSAVYVSGFDFDDYLQALNERGYEGIADVVNDPARKLVLATPPWPGEARMARYKPDAGCSLSFHDAGTTPPKQDIDNSHSDDGKATKPQARRPKPDSVRLVRQRNLRLQASLNQYFIDDPRTFAALIWQGGIIRAERYGDGITAQTPLIGWSMTKSLAHAMFGVLMQRNIVSLNSTDLLAQWRTDTDDPRRRISAYDLMRMSSGLAFGENYQIGGDAITMLFNRADIVAYAANFELAHPIGDHWSYSSATTNILGRVMTEALGEPLMSYMKKELFDVIGTKKMLVETDAVGNPILSSFGFGTARDWLRLGILYMRDGDWFGKRIFPAGHAANAAALTPASEGVYGQHFWLNRPRPDGTLQFAALPEDSYMMSGFDGQHVVIIPSRELIMVRLGMNPDDDPNLAFDLNDFSKRLLLHL